MSLWVPILQALFPAQCPGCGDDAPALCSQCAVTVRAPAPARPPPGVDWWVAAYAYEGVVRELIARAKYRQARTGLPWLGTALTGAVREAVAGGAALPEVVTWPPTTALRRRQRGFDQAQRLAGYTGAALGLPVRELLGRLAGPAQTGRSRHERAEGPLFTCLVPVREARVLVVDDVATTGVTLAAAAAALRLAGAQSVAAATAARTPLRTDRQGAMLPARFKGSNPCADTLNEPICG